MPAQYLDDYVRELKREGEQAFQARYTTPVLIVVQAGGELREEAAAANEATVQASSSGWRLQELSLLNRVFELAKEAFAIPGPVSLGRADGNDISVPEESISKRHCTFEIGPDGVRVTDLASTNGITVDGKPLPPHAPFALSGGEVLAIGNFSFLFHTPATFLAHLRELGAT
jgi:hypothetical protein